MATGVLNRVRDRIPQIGLGRPLPGRYPPRRFKKRSFLVLRQSHMKWTGWGARALLLSGLLTLVGFPSVFGNVGASPSDNPVQHVDARVSGGQPVRSNAFPWTAQINLPGNKMCGGALITCQLVVTAAHCLQPFSESSLIFEGSVILGDARKDSGRSFGISNVAIHPDYDASGFDSSTNIPIHNDIAIITLNEPTAIKPVKIANRDPRVGSRGLVLGWGETEAGSSSAVLQQAVLEVVGAEGCDVATGKQYFDPQSSICTGSPGTERFASRRRRPSKGKPGGKGKPPKPERLDIGVQQAACQGDSGGPFFDPRSRKLWGVVSYAFDDEGPSSCGDEGRQTVFTSLQASWRDFIQAQVKDETCRRPHG